MVATLSFCGKQLMLSTFCIEHFFMKDLRSKKGGVLVSISMTMEPTSNKGGFNLSISFLRAETTIWTSCLPHECLFH